MSAEWHSLNWRRNNVVFLLPTISISRWNTIGEFYSYVDEDPEWPRPSGKRDTDPPRETYTDITCYWLWWGFGFTVITAT